MRKYILPIILSIFIATTFFACKEEEVSDQQFVKNHFIGKWPLKLTINITAKNGDTTINDTTFYGLDTPNIVLPVDTFLYTPENKFIKKGKTVEYKVDEKGDYITYTTTPAETWKIKYLRLKSIILTQEKTEQKGSDTFTYYTEEQLIRPR